MLDPHVWWPLFPLLLLVVVVCLTWATVYVVRKSRGATTIWLQSGALACYLLAAATAIASEKGLIHPDIHRPFSLQANHLTMSTIMDSDQRRAFVSRSESPIREAVPACVVPECTPSATLPSWCNLFRTPQASFEIPRPTPHAFRTAASVPLATTPGAREAIEDRT